MAHGRIRWRKNSHSDESSAERNVSQSTRSKPSKAGIGKNWNEITDESI